jgi:nucleotide-binding universal stress UspA family protein
MNTIFKTILCPIESDELYLDALEFSRSIARQNDAKLYVLTVVSKFSAEEGLESGNRVGLREAARTELLDNVPYEFVIRTGEVVDEIIAAVESLKVDLVVIPTHGRRGLSRVVLGSVAERIVRESPVPVLTLRSQ